MGYEQVPSPRCSLSPLSSRMTSSLALPLSSVCDFISPTPSSLTWQAVAEQFHVLVQGGEHSVPGTVDYRFRMQTPLIGLFRGPKPEHSLGDKHTMQTINR